MNKLRDWFKQMAGGETRRIGFGAFSSKPKSPTIGLLATLPSLGPEVVAEAREAGAEGLIVPAGLAADTERLQEAMKSSTGCLWGLQLGDSQAPESVEGFDFFLVSSSSYLSVLEPEDKGKLLSIDPSWDDMQLRAVDQTPLDGAVLSLLPAGEERARLEHLLNLRRISMLIRKPLVIELRRPLPAKELAALRDGGLTAVLVPGDAQKWATAIKELRQAIENLPSRAKPPRETDAVLPAIPSGRAPESEPEKEDEEL